MSWPGCNFTCAGLDTVLRHVLVGTQFYDMSWSGHSFTTCPGRDTVLQHALVGTQFSDLPWSRCTKELHDLLDADIDVGFSTTTMTKVCCRLVQLQNTYIMNASNENYILLPHNTLDYSKHKPQRRIPH